MAAGRRVAIIGAGIIGAAIARVLSRFENLQLYILEENYDVGGNASRANSSVIHPGHEEDPDNQPLRARLCVEGNALWKRWCEELEIPVKWVGELMLFERNEDEKEAEKYVEWARRNNVAGVRILYGEDLFKMDSSISRNVKGGVYAPTAGLISPFEAVVALVENAVDNGVRLLTETRVKRIIARNNNIVGVETSTGFIETDIVINAAGLNADQVSHSAGVEPWFRIKPRKGEYVIFDKDAEPKPSLVLHTMPTPITKGVYALTTIHGNLMIGPTAEDLPYESKIDTSTSLKGLNQLVKEAGRILRRTPPRSKIIKFFAGLRPEPPDGKWLIKAYSQPYGFVNVAGIRSPGLTAAPAIANYVLSLLRETYGLRLVEKKEWKPSRRRISTVNEMDYSTLDKRISENPDYGEIICFCNNVSRAEVSEAVERMRAIGVKTITFDGVKLRTTAGFGKCQASRCRIRIALLISEAVGIPLHSVIMKKSSIGIGGVKTLWMESKEGVKND
ncbi:MAG: NAD(P)/FAD-dependent oxidoreductase [Candidatus Brockarchaeota archaeon]|nr:NAD(P)/FAD-dependent oxidoreductase [Candidatus Brockarchaeota archaeon]